MLLVIVLTPLLLLALLVPRVTRAHALRLAPWAPLPALLLAVLAPTEAVAEWPALLLGIRLGLDPIGRVFLLLTAVIWLASGWYAWEWFANRTRPARFCAFFLAAQAGNLGVCVAQGAVDFYVFFALMSFAAYGLIIHDGTPVSRRAGRVYLALTVVGEMLILAGLMLLVAGFDTSLFAAFTIQGDPPAYLAIATGCVVLGFGVKVGLPLLHYSLPLAYAVTPIPAAAVLAGAMIKAGVLGWMRFLPLGEVSWPGFGAVMIGVGLIGIFYGAIVGLTQRDPGALLGYSSMSQMGYIVIAFGAGLSAPTLWPWLAVAVTLYATHHAFAKAALFLGLGLVERRGLTPWIAAGLALPVLALAGAPFTSGLLAKTTLKSAVATLPAPWGQGLPVLMAVGAVVTALLMLRWLWLLHQRPAAPKSEVGALLPGWALTLVASAGLTFILAPLEAWRSSFEAATLLEAIWPLALAVALAGLFAWRRIDLPLLPPGDLVLAIERAAGAINRAFAAWPPRLRKPSVPRAALRSPWLETRLRTWPLAATLWLLLLVTMILSLSL
ncbi:MAG: complex I subunit 5 family protein [Thiotrichales bacterium]